MKQKVLIALFVASALSAQAALKISEKMPATDVKLKGEKETSLAKLAGEKGTLVIVTCNHCPYAIAWEKRIVELGNAYSKKGIGVVAVNANDPGIVPGDSREKTLERAKAAGFKFPYVVDETQELAKALGAAKTPECYLFDKAGKLVYHGAVDDNHKDAGKVESHYLRDALDALLAGKEIAVKETKAMGCGVKYRK
jgi:peroxiredoxin